MKLLKEMRFYHKRGNFPKQVYENCAALHEAFDCGILTEDESPNKQEVLDLINNNNFVRNDYESFVSNLSKGKRSSYLTQYTPQEFKDRNVETYQLQNYPIGYALIPSPDGKDKDIVSVHNNSDVRGIGDALIQSAIRNGGTTLDHFDGYLTNFYSQNGFEEIGRDKWSDEYAPTDWNYERDGRPDVIYRRLKR